MNKYILVVRPSFDRTTKYLSAWAEKNFKLAVEKGNTILDLKDKRAKRKEVVSMIKKQQPAFIFFNGHGSSDCIAGQDNEILIKAGDNDNIINSAIVYSLSCQSGIELGPKLTQNVSNTFIGYNNDFIFVWDVEKRTRPLEDKIAELFFMPSNQVITSLLKGHTARESSINSKNCFLRNIYRLLTSEASPEETTSVKYLLWDAQHQICLGNNDATI